MNNGWLKELRMEMDLSQREFAKLVGVTNNTVCRWERGHGISDESLRKIKKLLGNNGAASKKNISTVKPVEKAKPVASKPATANKSAKISEVSVSVPRKFCAKIAVNGITIGVYENMTEEAIKRCIRAIRCA